MRLEGREAEQEPWFPFGGANGVIKRVCVGLRILWASDWEVGREGCSLTAMHCLSPEFSHAEVGCELPCRAGQTGQRPRESQMGPGKQCFFAPSGPKDRNGPIGDPVALGNLRATQHWAPFLVLTFLGDFGQVT